MTLPHARRPAFTIIELLVVISIIGVLLGLLLPALGGAKRRSRKMQEMSHLRQVGIGWMGYANSHNDAALPGYIETDAQLRWKVKFKYPDSTTIPPAPNFGAGDPNIAGPWTWRLMPYFDNSHDIVHGYLGEPEGDIFSMIAEADEIAVTPAFAYNSFYMGGWMEEVEGLNGDTFVAPRFFDAKDPNNGNRLNVVTKTLSQMRRSSDLIVFCSAVLGDPRSMQAPPDNFPGSHFVTPPTLAELPLWSNGTTRDNSRVQAVSSLDGADPPIPFGRHNGQAAILHGDGSTDAQTPGALTDMRLWVNAADRSDFTHTER